MRLEKLFIHSQQQTVEAFSVWQAIIDTEMFWMWKFALFSLSQSWSMPAYLNPDHKKGKEKSLSEGLRWAFSRWVLSCIKVWGCFKKMLLSCWAFSAGKCAQAKQHVVLQHLQSDSAKGNHSLRPFAFSSLLPSGDAHVACSRTRRHTNMH